MLPFFHRAGLKMYIVPEVDLSGLEMIIAYAVDGWHNDNINQTLNLKHNIII